MTCPTGNQRKEMNFIQGSLEKFLKFIKENCRFFHYVFILFFTFVTCFKSLLSLKWKGVLSGSLVDEHVGKSLWKTYARREA